jgi:transposase-like protein
MNKAAKRQIIRRTEKEKLALIEQWEQSGLSIKKFCNEHQFSDSLFHSWLNKYWRNKEGKTVNHFVPLQFTAPITLTEENRALFAEVLLKGGSCIKLYQPVAVEYLRTLTA